MNVTAWTPGVWAVELDPADCDGVRIVGYVRQRNSHCPHNMEWDWEVGFGNPEIIGSCWDRARADLGHAMTRTLIGADGHGWYLERPATSSPNNGHQPFRHAHDLTENHLTGTPWVIDVERHAAGSGTEVLRPGTTEHTSQLGAVIHVALWNTFTTSAAGTAAVAKAHQQLLVERVAVLRGHLANINQTLNQLTDNRLIDNEVRHRQQLETELEAILDQLT